MNVLDVPLVSLEDAIDSTDLWLIEVAIEREAVACLMLSHEARDASEAEAGEVLVVVVLLENIAYLLYSLRVIIVRSVRV